jgi:hypothetical protein
MFDLANQNETSECSLMLRTIAVVFLTEKLLSFFVATVFLAFPSFVFGEGDMVRLKDRAAITDTG